MNLEINKFFQDKLPNESVRIVFFNCMILLAYIFILFSVMDCANEIRANDPESVNNDDDIVDTAISHDGTWQQRGYSSLNGCTTAISMETGKILDVEPMSRYCKACNLKENLKKTDPAQYDFWKVNHVCSYNYTGL